MALQPGSVGRPWKTVKQELTLRPAAALLRKAANCETAFGFWSSPVLGMEREEEEVRGRGKNGRCDDGGLW